MRININAYSYCLLDLLDNLLRFPILFHINISILHHMNLWLSVPLNHS